MSDILFKVGAAALLILAIFGYGFSKGSGYKQAKWDAEKQRQAEMAEMQRQSWQSSIDKGTTKFAAKAAKDRVIVQTIIKEVDRYVPITDPVLSGGFRLFHDAAATGEVIDDSKRTDAAPVTSATVARVIADNYASCNYEKQRVILLQDVVRVLNGD